MILIEITGNKGEGSQCSLLSIIQLLLMQSDTNKIFVFDYDMEISSYLTSWLCTDCISKELFNSGEIESILANPNLISEKVCIIRPFALELSEPSELTIFIEEVMKKLESFKINCNCKNYCLLQKWSI